MYSIIIRAPSGNFAEPVKQWKTCSSPITPLPVPLLCNYSMWARNCPKCQRQPWSSTGRLRRRVAMTCLTCARHWEWHFEHTSRPIRYAQSPEMFASCITGVDLCYGRSSYRRCRSVLVQPTLSFRPSPKRRTSCRFCWNAKTADGKAV